MKKFYTMMGVAALGLTMAANAAPQMQMRAKSQGEIVEAAKAKIENVQTMNRNKVRAAKENAQLTAADVLGNYQHDEYRAVAGSSGMNYGMSYPEFVAGSNDNEVIINGFWMGSNEEGNPYGSFTATFDPEAMTLSIPAGTKVFSAPLEGGSLLDCYMYIQDWDTSVCSADPIVLEYDPELCQFYWQSNGLDTGSPTDNIIITSEANGVGVEVTKGVDFALILQFSYWNSSMSLMQNGQQGYFPVRVTVDAPNSTFTVYNLGDWGYEIPVTFNVDPTAKTVVAPRTLYGEDVTLDNSGTKADVYFATEDGGSISGTYTNQDNQGLISSVVSLEDWTLWTVEYGAVLQYPYTDTMIVVPFDLDSMVGVENIAVDTNADDVVYYNLQGVKVLNPAPGQLVIARQGGKAVKMIAK